MVVLSSDGPLLLSPLALRGLTLRNRIVISPMCQYAAVDGVPQAWQLAHLGRFAMGGAGLVFTEATGVEPRGRITPACTGLWNDQQTEAWKPIVAFVKDQGAAIGMQLAHAGRKGSSRPPWEGGTALTGEDAATGRPPWTTVAPSAVPFPGWPDPHALDAGEIAEMIGFWRDAALRALDAGFDVIEIHGAHGYLLHSFLSPLSNHRDDAWGGDATRRMRLPLEVVEAVRAVWPEGRPLFYRISAVDYAEGGLTIEDTTAFARELKARGVDVVDCSSGALVPAKIPFEPGYQVPFAEAVRRGADLKTMAVGLILEPEQAEAILRSGQADLIALARAALADPNWPVRAKAHLAPDAPWDDYAVKSGFWLKTRADLLRKLGIETDR